MFFFTSPKLVEGSTSFVPFLMNPPVVWTCAHRRCMAPLRPHMASAFLFNEVLFWAEDREETAGRLHPFIQEDEARSTPGERLGLACACCPPPSPHPNLIPISSLQAAPQFYWGLHQSSLSPHLRILFTADSTL